MRVLEGGRGGDLTIIGPRTRALLKDAAGFAYAISFRFKPGWSTPVLGVPARELTNRFVSLEELWGRGATELLTESIQARTEPQVIELVSRAFVRRIRHAAEPSSARLARRAARLMEGDEVRIDRIAGRLGVTARHLRRAFAENIGIGPKEYARSARLQRVVRMAATSSDWAQIAAEAGYFDQAHLIADFRGLVGLTPGAFQKRATDPEPLVPAST